MTKAKQIGVWGILALIALAFVYVKFSPSPQTAGKAPGTQQSAEGGPRIPVTVTKAARGDFDVYLSGIGNVQPYASIAIRSRVDGEIVNLNFKEGQIVNKGDLLVEIDSRQYRAALISAEAKKAQDITNFENAKADLQRLEKLGEFAAAKQIDTQRALVEQLSAQIRADDAAVANAQTQLSYTHIEAPLTGRIGLRQIDQGNIVTSASSNPIATIDQIEPISIVFSQPEDVINEINTALAMGPVKVLAYTSNGATLLDTGHLEFIDNSIDTTTGTIRMKATFDNSDHRLWPGMAVSVKLLLKTLKDVVILPEQAVQRSPSGLFVYKVDANDRVQRQSIEAGATNGKQVVMTKGVENDELVVVTGQSKLRPGAAIEYAKPN